jgi:hypothetical protein
MNSIYSTRIRRKYLTTYWSELTKSPKKYALVEDLVYLLN